MLVVAAVVWLAAGANIMSMGVSAYGEALSAVAPGAHHGVALAMLAGTVATFLLFHLMIFAKVVRTNSARVLSLDAPDGRAGVLRFLDTKGYLIMGAMMAMGIGLRLSGMVPSWFIGSFYVGLGAALVAGASQFTVRRVRASKASEAVR